MPGIDLQQLFKQHAFESVLWISSDYSKENNNRISNIEYRHVSQLGVPESLEGHWDLVVVEEELLKLPRERAIQTLSRLRDLHARRLVVLLPPHPDASHTVQHEDLISLGLKALESKPGIFYHDLYDYKDTPDWLNNRYWANPENWDKFRW
jgi:hypothetical protein